MGSGIVKVYLTAPSAATLDVIHQSVGSTSLGSATPTVVAVKWRPGRPRGFDVVTYRSADAAAEPIDLTHDLGAAWWRWSAVLSGFAGSRSGARRLGGRVSSGRGLRVDAAERRSFDHPANGAGPAEAVSWCRWLGAEAGVSAGDLVKLDRFASTTRIARVIGGIERETPFITLYGAPQLDLAPL